RQARRFAGPTVRESRTDPQPDRRQGARHHLPAPAARPRRGGDRMTRDRMHRRSFLTLLGASAAAWPLAAQQGGRVGRIGWLIGGAENDLASRSNRAALQEALAKLGWIEGRNLRIDLRFGAGDPDRMSAYALELVGLKPDVMLTDSGAPTRALQQQTQ